MPPGVRSLRGEAVVNLMSIRVPVMAPADRKMTAVIGGPIRGAGHRSLYPSGGAEISALPAALLSRYWTVILAVLLGTPPTVTTTSCNPGGTPFGIVKLIWVTPTSPQGIPMKSG